MLLYLDALKNDELSRRRETLLLDIRAGTDSFFDAFRSLSECFLKHLLAAAEHPFAPNDGVGKLLRDGAVQTLLGEVYTIPKEAVAKLSDYILKINKHVHSREKQADKDGVFAYLLAFYRFSAPAASVLGATPTPPDPIAFDALFCSHAEEVKQAKEAAEEKNARMFERILDRVDDLERKVTQPKAPPVIPIRDCTQYFLSEQREDAHSASLSRMRMLYSAALILLGVFALCSLLAFGMLSLLFLIPAIYLAFVLIALRSDCNGMPRVMECAEFEDCTPMHAYTSPRGVRYMDGWIKDRDGGFLPLTVILAILSVVLPLFVGSSFFTGLCIFFAILSVIMAICVVSFTKSFYNTYSLTVLVFKEYRFYFIVGQEQLDHDRVNALVGGIPPIP